MKAYDEVRAQQQRATHRQKRNYDSKAVACTFPIGCWVLRYYPPARKDKLCSPWIGPYKVVHAPMEWVVGIQVDADARIFYIHMDDLKCCAFPDPTPSWHFHHTQQTRTFYSRTDNSRPTPSRIRQRSDGNVGQSTQSDDSGDGDARAPYNCLHRKFYC